MRRLRRTYDGLCSVPPEGWVVREAGPPRYFASALGAAEEFRQAAALASAPLGQVLPSVQHINDQTSTDEVIAPFGGGSLRERVPHRRPGGELGGVHGNAMDNGQSGARELPLLIRH